MVEKMTLLKMRSQRRSGFSCSDFNFFDS